MSYYICDNFGKVSFSVSEKQFQDFFNDILSVGHLVYVQQTIWGCEYFVNSLKQRRGFIIYD